MSEKPRAYTKEEVREQFLQYIWNLIEYWEHVPGKSVRERMSGTAFSILVALDGEAADLPAFAVRCRPHPNDRDYCKQEGKNWYPKGVDIAGSLHDGLCKSDPRKRH